jgi:hypothetical protein
VVRPDLVPVPRPVLLWVTEVRPVPLTVVIPDLVLGQGLFPDLRPVPVCPVPVCLDPVLAQFQPPACRPVLPEHRQATADAVASLAA